MQYNSEYQLGTRSLEKHFHVTMAIGLAPIILCASFIANVKGWQSALVFLILGCTIGLDLILWGLYEIMFTPSPNSRLGERFKTNAPRWFPMVMLIFRYIFFIFTFLVIWKCIIWLNFKPTLWIRITFFMVLVITPIRKLTDKLASPDRKKAADIAIELLKHFHINTLVFFVLGMVNATFLTEKTFQAGIAPPPYTITWTIGILTVLSSMIILLDFFARYEQHRAL